MFQLACFLAVVSLAACQVMPPRTPMNVYVTVTFNSLDKIDGVEQAFNTDFWLSYYWYDPRVDLNVTAFDVNTMWDPAVDFVNSRGATEPFVPEKFEYSVLSNPATMITNALPEDLATFGSNWVQFNQRYIGSFTAHLDLKQFPFDSQIAQIVLESSIYNVDEVVFRPSKPELAFEADLLPDDFIMTEWDLTDKKVVVTTKYYNTYRETYSSFRVEVHASRKPEYYLQKIVAGCVLLVLMCITIFVIDVEEPDRMMGTLTVFLALISFVFVAAADLPKVTYLTKMDSFIFVSFLLVALMAFAHMVAYAINLHTKEEEDDEKKKEKDKKKSDDADDDKKGEQKAKKKPEKVVPLVSSNSSTTSSITSSGGSAAKGAAASGGAAVNIFGKSAGDGTRQRKGASVRSSADLDTAEEQQEEPSSAMVEPKKKSKQKADADKKKTRAKTCCGRFVQSCRGMGVVRKMDISLMIIFLVVYVIAIAVILRKTQ